MNGYILNFLVYTMAMIGIMFLAVVVYKKTYSFGKPSNNKNDMKIEESLALSPKKTLYVVNVKNEKFLIASDAERTSFLAKLGEDNIPKAKVRKTKQYDSLSENLHNDFNYDLKNDKKQRDYVSQNFQQKEQQITGLIPGINPEEIRRAAMLKNKTLAQPTKSFNQTMVEQANQKTPVIRNLASQITLKRG